nr:hypothetical protein [uncultured archaeon]
MKFSFEKERIFDFILYILGITLIINFYHSNTLLLVIISIFWLAGLIIWRNYNDFIFFLVGAVIGTIAEIICINEGVWQYSNPSFIGIPIWLPFAWGLATILIKRTAESILRFKIK